MMAAGFLPFGPRARSSERSDAAIASPVAVPPSAARASTDSRTAVRARRGVSIRVTRSLKATLPTLTSRGTSSRNPVAARRTAVIRLGRTSVARIEADRSVASTTAARPSGTATVRSGRAKASASAISASA